MRGFTLIEAMVALVLLSFTAVALTECLLTAQRLQRESGRWMRAAALAEEALERARAGTASGSDEVGSFRRHWTTAAAGARLRRIDADVRWDEHLLRLSTLVFSGG